MQRSIRLLPLIWITAWVVGCAPAPAPPAPTPTAARPASLVAHGSKTAASLPSTQPAPPVTGSGVQVNVTLADHGVSSSLTAFKTGVPYIFVIKNTGTRGICFDIATPVSVTGSMGASQGAALVDIPESRLTVGATVTDSFTFPDSAAGAPLEMSCLQRRAYDDKVRLAITVTK